MENLISWLAIRLCGECGRGNVQTVAITVIDANARSAIILEVCSSLLHSNLGGCCSLQVDSI